MNLIANAGVNLAPMHNGKAYKHVGFADADWEPAGDVWFLSLAVMSLCFLICSCWCFCTFATFGSMFQSVLRLSNRHLFIAGSVLPIHEAGQSSRL